VKGLQDCLDEIVLQEQNIERIADIIFRAYKKGKQVFVIGNGGSASTASHCALGFEKQCTIEGKPRIRSKSLTDNIALITAWANDIDYASIFEQQLMNQLDDGDVLIAISASGNSPNIIRAAEYAKGKGATVIGFTGFSGGKLKGIVSECLSLSSRNYGQVEDVHLALTHIISDMLRERIARD
jgi:D-sedoheptulose 7-phosphate isomerase